MSTRAGGSGRRQRTRGTPGGARGIGARADRPNLSAPQRLTAFLIVVLLCAAPLLVVPSAKEAFRLVQGLASAWLGLASLAVASLLLRQAGSPISAAALWQRPAIRALLPLAAVVAAGALLTSHPRHFRAAFADFAIGAACVVGWSLALGEGTLRRLLRWTIPAAAIVAVLGLDQFLGWFGLLDWLHVDAPTARLRLTSTVGNPGDLASLLVLPTLIALSLFREAERRTRIALGSAVAIMLLTIAVTATLAAVAAVVAGSAVWWWLSWRAVDRSGDDGGGGTGRRRFVPALVVAVAIGAVGLAALAVSPLGARMVEKVEQAASGDINALLTGRLDGWRVAWRMLRESPVAGVGQGAFRAEFADTRLALMAEGVPFFAEQHQVMLATPHNEALSVAAEQGLPGLLALGWALGCLAVAAWREPRRGVAQTQAEGGSTATAVAGLVALGMLATFWFPLHTPAVAWPWLLFLAWVCRRSDAGARAEIAVPAAAARAWASADDSRATGRRPTVTRARLLFPVVLVGLLVPLAWQTWRVRDRLTASVLLARVEARTLAAIQMQRAPSSLFDENLAWLDEAGRRDPLEIGVPIARGTQFLLLRRPDDALAAYREAAALEPRPEIDLNIGRALWMNGDRDDARAAFARALRLNPLLRSEVPPAALE